MTSIHMTLSKRTHKIIWVFVTIVIVTGMLLSFIVPGVSLIY